MIPITLGSSPQKGFTVRVIAREEIVMLYFSVAAVIDSAGLSAIPADANAPEFFWDDYFPLPAQDNVVAIGARLADDRLPEPPTPVAPVPRAA